MAKGRPDWTTSINITGQDLLEVIDRPKYGSAQVAAYSDIISEDASDVLCSIAGTGMIYGGIIKHTGTFDPGSIYLKPVIDGAVIAYFDLEDMNKWILENESMWYIYEKYYSEEYDKYIQGISRGITFETSWELTVQNYTGSGGSDLVYCDVIYALI